MKTVNYYAALNTTSYGYCGSYFLRELLNKGVDVRYFPVTTTQPDPNIPFKTEELNTDALIGDGPCLKIWHQHSLETFIGKGPHVAFPIFELDSFSDREKNHLLSTDGTIVCSKWAQSVLDSVGVASDVVKLGYNPEIFKPSESRRQRAMASGQEEAPFVFANFGKWEIRKGHDVLKEAFNLAFTEEDNVELWLMTANYHINEYQQKSWYNYYQNSKLGSKIKFAPRVPSQLEVYEIMKDIDCAVFPARAEGWNLEALEALACGKTIIATNVTGHTEFLNNNNAFLLDLEEKEVAYDGVFFNGQGNWHKFTKSKLDDLVSLMRKVYENDSVTNSNGIRDAQSLTWPAVTDDLIKVLAKYD